MRATILVAEANATFLGYVQFGDVDIPELEVRPGDQELHRIYVDTAAQGTEDLVMLLDRSDAVSRT